MKIWKSLSGKIEGSVITSGIFDGIHIGHQTLIKKTVKSAKKRGIPSILLTFHPHPRSALFILAEKERERLIEELGIDIMLYLDFNEIKDLQPERFVQEILIETLGMKEIWIGSDHRFGKAQEGDVGLLRKLSGRYDFEVFCMSDVILENERVSSSKVKELLASGRIQEAERLLGRPYTVNLPVIKGAGRGKGMGAKTVNMDWPDIFLPRLGVYGVKVKIVHSQQSTVHSEEAKIVNSQQSIVNRQQNTEYRIQNTEYSKEESQQSTVNSPQSTVNSKERETMDNGLWTMDNFDGAELDGIGNLGRRPTFSENELLFEVHIFGFSGNLYGKNLSVQFLEWIRDEIRFSSKEALSAQIKKDIEKLARRRGDIVSYGGCACGSMEEQRTSNP